MNQKKEICKSCAVGRCFAPPLMELGLELSRCTRILDYVVEDPLIPQSFKAHNDTLVVDNRSYVVAPTEPTYCRCKWSNALYKVGNWRYSDDQYNITKGAAACWGDFLPQ
jgi:hypothetical protein